MRLPDCGFERIAEVIRGKSGLLIDPKSKGQGWGCFLNNYICLRHCLQKYQKQ